MTEWLESMHAAPDVCGPLTLARMLFGGFVEHVRFRQEDREAIVETIWAWARFTAERRALPVAARKEWEAILPKLLRDWEVLYESRKFVAHRVACPNAVDFRRLGGSGDTVACRGLSRKTAPA
jgi:hypothetical protein